MFRLRLSKEFPFEFEGGIDSPMLSVISGHRKNVVLKKQTKKEVSAGDYGGTKEV